MSWNKNAIGLVTRAAGWENHDFDFIIGYAGGDWSPDRANPKNLVLEPNSQLAPIEAQARAEGKAFGVLLDFNVFYYSDAQIKATDGTWPPLADDYPYQRFTAMLKDRDPDFIVLRVMTRKTKELADKIEMMRYVGYAAGKMVTRLNEWFYTSKHNLNKQTFVLTCDPFIHQDDRDHPEDYNFFYSWMSDPAMPLIGVEQANTVGLVNSYPADAEFPRAIGNTSWSLWYYHWPYPTGNWATEAPYLDRGQGLALYNGDAARLRGLLGLPATADPGGPTPPPPADGGGDGGTGDGGTGDGGTGTPPAGMDEVLGGLAEISGTVDDIKQMVSKLYGLFNWQ